MNEWVNKAQQDYLVAIHLSSQENASLWYDTICFHCQQAVEKYLKAFLKMNNQIIPKIHDLVALMNLCKQFDNEIESMLLQLAHLNQYSVTFRYPDGVASKENANQAVKDMKTFLTLIEKKLEKFGKL